MSLLACLNLCRQGMSRADSVKQLLTSVTASCVFCRLLGLCKDCAVQPEVDFTSTTTNHALWSTKHAMQLDEGQSLGLGLGGDHRVSLNWEHKGLIRFKKGQGVTAAEAKRELRQSFTFTLLMAEIRFGD